MLCRQRLARSLAPAQNQCSSYIKKQIRHAATTSTGKKEGTIADAFASLSGQAFAPLEPRFADIKRELIRGNEEAVTASWQRLLTRLQVETKLISDLGSRVIPEIDYTEIQQPDEAFSQEYRKRGVAVIRNVIPRDEANALKEELRQYIKANPQTKAFPEDNPQVYELYWSPTQVKARSDPNLLQAQRFLLNYWHSKDPNALVTSEPILYADRLRMRLPGDAKFALGPHIDGGGPERWEPAGYGKAHTYDSVFQGRWEEYDPWESSTRLDVDSDLYQGGGACSAFRMAQGWLSLSRTGPFEGTLLVNPLLQLATAYVLLRPFFTPKSSPTNSSATSVDSLAYSRFLHPDNWVLESPMSSWLQGASPGRGQELSSELHPHLLLDKTMIHMPTVSPGDYVAWNCDTIHAVDKVHAGKSDSSVLYIPACPLTERNAEYLVRQRGTFLHGTPSPDFPGGIGESHHKGRMLAEDAAAVSDQNGMRAFGLERWDSTREGLSPGERETMRKANEILGFA